MIDRSQALARIIELARTYNLTSAEIAEALIETPQAAAENRATRFLTSIGGIFIFAGLGAFIGMFWDEMNAAARVIITLGAGFAIFTTGVMAAKSTDGRMQKAIAPLLIIGAFMQPSGLFVFLHEYFPPSNDYHAAGMFVFGVMLVQQFFCFWATRRATLLFFSLLFGALLLATIFDDMHVKEYWSASIIGFSLLNLAYALAQSPYRGIGSFWFFVGGATFLAGSFEAFRDTPIELLYLALACVMVFVSIVVRSTALMIVSVLSILGYVAYYTNMHFRHSLGWPGTLVLLGLIFLGVGVGAVRLKRSLA